MKHTKTNNVNNVELEYTRTHPKPCVIKASNVRYVTYDRQNRVADTPIGGRQ